MAYNNKIIRRLHRDQFSPLAWLERLENAQQSFCYHQGSDSPLPIELDSTLIGLQKALEQLEASIKREKVLLFPLLRAAGETSMLASLRPHRQRISALVGQLLHAVVSVRPQPSLFPSAVQSVLNKSQPQGHKEDHWDDAIRLVPELSNRLIRYLHAAETDYLPMADYLLGPSDDGQPTVTPEFQRPEYVFQALSRSWTATSPS